MSDEDAIREVLLRRAVCDALIIISDLEHQAQETRNRLLRVLGNADEKSTEGRTLDEDLIRKEILLKQALKTLIRDCEDEQAKLEFKQVNTDTEWMKKYTGIDFNLRSAISRAKLALIDRDILIDKKPSDRSDIPDRETFDRELHNSPEEKEKNP